MGRSDLSFGPVTNGRELARGVLLRVEQDVAWANRTRWRRTGALVKTPWRVRVILRNDEGLLLQQNHELVSSWLPLHKLPLDTYVRDEIFFPLPPAEKSPSATSPAELLLELEDAQGATISAGREPLLTGVPLP